MSEKDKQKLPVLYDPNVVSHADFSALMGQILNYYTTSEEFRERNDWEEQSTHIRHIQMGMRDYSKAYKKMEG